MRRIQTTKQKFGFLTSPVEFQFNDVCITVCENYEKNLESVINNSNLDGYFYPPQVVSYESNLISVEKKKKINRSERPAQVFHLPASHKIVIDNTILCENPECSTEALIIHLLSFLYDTRLQFEEWRFEGRVLVKKNSKSFIFSEEIAQHFLAHVHEWWLTQNSTIKTKFINIVYMHCRAKNIESNWDRFIHQYMVFDAIWNLFKSDNKKPFIPHKKRMEFLCQHYEIVFDDETITKICQLRNELFHEALWSGLFIGMGESEYNAIHSLTNLNAKLICNISGYQSNFSRFGWWFYGHQSFDKY